MSHDARNLLDMVPVQRRAWEGRGDGGLDVLLPRYGEGRVGRLLKSIFSDKPVRVHLDDVGASVWRLCDGRRSVYEIGESLHAEFGKRIEPVYDRLEVFLKQMDSAGLIEWRR